jgi:hypothetical protein
MVNSRIYPRYRCGGRFYGRRVNCEGVPLLTAWAIDQMLRDPRNVPHLLIWRARRDGTIQEAVRLAPCAAPDLRAPLDWAGVIEIKRQDGTGNFIRTLSRHLRQGGGFRLLICPTCHKPRRALYGWQPGGPYTTSVVRSRWQCRVVLDYAMRLRAEPC